MCQDLRDDSFQKMQFLTIEILFLMVFVADIIQTQLSPTGENVCLHTENYQETVEVDVYKPVIKKVKKWCFKFIPYRCSKTEKSMKRVREPQVVQRTKIVPKCCSGFKEITEQVTKCLPVCLNECKNGKCAAPNTCACLPGFYGAECEKECPDNFWGEKCVNKCDCSDNGKCHKVFGRCECEPGWRGERCELPCQNGYYGHHCEEKCNCDDYLCNHTTGECTTTTIVDHTLSSTQSEATISNTETETFTENCEQTEMSISTTEITISTYGVPKTIINSIFEENILEGVSASGGMAPRATGTTVGGSTTAKFRQEANESENEMKLISFDKKGFSTNPETTTEIVNKLENKTEEMPFSATYSIYNSTEYATYGTIFTDFERETDINETNNFIYQGKENSYSQRIVTVYNFLPSFCIISSVSILIIIIAARRVISTYRKKAEKASKRTAKIEFCQREEQIKFQTENFFWVNNCTKNPVYLSDVESNNTTPILETFKPLSSDNSFISKENEIKTINGERNDHRLKFH